jgi:hypothetical protein
MPDSFRWRIDMSKFVAEKENKYFAYYKLIPKRGEGWLIRALNAQQAIAQVLPDYRNKNAPIFCVISI